MNSYDYQLKADRSLKKKSYLVGGALLWVAVALHAQVAPGKYIGTFTCAPNSQNGQRSTPLEVEVDGELVQWKRVGVSQGVKYVETATSFLRDGAVSISGGGNFEPDGAISGWWTINGGLVLSGASLEGKVNQLVRNRITSECVVSIPVQLRESAPGNSGTPVATLAPTGPAQIGQPKLANAAGNSNEAADYQLKRAAEEQRAATQGKTSGPTQTRAPNTPKQNGAPSGNSPLGELKRARQQAINMLSSWDTSGVVCRRQQGNFARQLDATDQRVSLSLDRGQLDSLFLVEQYAMQYQVIAKNIQALGENMRCIG